MRFDFSRLLREIASRHRKLRGAMLASWCLLLGGALALLVCTGLHLLLPDASIWITVAPPVAALAAAGIAYLLRWQDEPDLPHVLIRLDDALGSKALISSLYEVRQRAGNSLFRERLEPLVAQVASDWQRGMPRPRHAVLFSSIGACLLALSLALLVIPLPTLRTQATLPPIETSTSSRPMADITSATGQDALATASETAEDEAASVLPQDDLNIVDDPRSENAHVTPPQDDVNLDSVLKELQEIGGSNSTLVRNPDAEGLSELTQAQQEALQTLANMIANTLDRMRSEGRSSMTEGEAQALQDAASQAGDPDLQDFTDELANDPDAREDAEDALQDLLNELDKEQSQSSESTETAQGQTQADEQQSTAIQGDEEAARQFLERTAEELEQQQAEDLQSEEHQGDTQSQSGSSGDQDQSNDGPAYSQVGERPEEDSMHGGSAGTPGEESETPEEEPEFVREDAPTTVGNEGEFINELVTKGVPLETEAAADGTGADAAVSHRVDYARIDSILRQRGLPDEALDAVKRYFEAISQPEGGS